MLCWSAAVAMAQEKPLRIAAAASLSTVLKELSPAFTQASGVKVELQLGASNALARQIEAGAPADVFFSADAATMERLAQQGLIKTATREDQLSNSLVIIVPRDSALTFQSVQDLAKPEIKRVATGDPQAVPVGVYAKKYLEQAGVWAAVAPKIVASENVRAALAAVESGNLDAGIVYKTDAAISPRVKIALELPPRAGLTITYPMAALTASEQPAAAQAYLDFLDSAAAKSAFAKAGFIVLPDADAQQ
jgi:molybdate transport system substrate-binding protein